MQSDRTSTPATPATTPANGKGSESSPKLFVRKARLDDAAAISALSARVYGEKIAFGEKTIRAQINNFPDGQFVAVLMGKVVGHCATFMIAEDLALRSHTWHEITGNGLAARHDPKGDYLYGMEVSVDPSCRRLRIGQRLYDARKALCQEYELKGIVFGGRMPSYSRNVRQYPNPLDYAHAVAEKRVRDTVIAFHLSNGFELQGVLKNYLPSDVQSGGNATHMIWRNPLYVPDRDKREAAGTLEPKNVVRVAAVQFQMRRIDSIEDFERQVEYFVDVASDYRSDFVTFPELFTLELLSLEKEPLPPAHGVEEITKYTDRFLAFMERLAVSYNINIVAGSHPTRVDNGEIRNVAYVFLRDGSVHAQEKIHPTPSEAYWWNIKGGNSAEVINTDCGPIGVLICYDSEFPELARHLVDQGALMLFVPFCTDERRSYMRVRTCAHARAIENQCYVVLSGVVGNLPNVENMDIHYAESAILTPSDFAFARDGVAADTAANTETIAIADLKLSDLRAARSAGTVRNLKDRRFDLYQVTWK